ncbi:MAG: Rhs family protein [Caldilinea sp. CFX5]|nr:Rhs family protein [Caldilinea sp. CFX5]
MYNLTVAVAHTFFVGEQQWLVHNCSKRPGGYITHDVDLHGNLSPRANRAPGHGNTLAEHRIQSHHPIQDEWARTNVPGYNRNDAPAILLPSVSGDPHALISAAQRAAANQRVQQGLSRWQSTTIREEFDFAYRTMINVGVPVDKVEKAVKDAYKYFDSLGAFE